jgi:cell division protein FtsB
MKIARVVFLVFFFFLFAAVPDSGADELLDLKKAVEEQERELQELRKKVEELEERRHLEDAAAEEMEDILPKFGANLGLFGDINYSTEEY